jgi:hypothetical protein
LAVTVAAEVRVTVQLPVPVQAPPFQPLNVKPVAGVAVRVIIVPYGYVTDVVEHFLNLGQMVPVVPVGALATVPCPTTLTVKVTGCSANEAVTAVAEVSVIVQVPVPLHPPFQPVKLDPVAGVAVSVTAVPTAKLPEQVAPQLIPAGVLVTVPAPVPARLTPRLTDCKVNVAVTVVAAVSVTVHVPVPVHPPPLQPANVDPVAGVAVSVTIVPLA